MKTCYLFLISFIAFTMQLLAQTLSPNQAHSHNDYKQATPFLLAYNAGVGSIEADVFLLKGKLYVAHERAEIVKGKTLSKLYLKPLAKRFRRNKQRPYPDSTWSLQLVIDIKEDYQNVIPKLIKELKPYQDVFNNPSNNHVVKIVLSGAMPPPIEFGNYPGYIFYDGRPYTYYTPSQLEHIAMVSNSIEKYTKWRGVGQLPAADSLRLRGLVDSAHANNKPFRFWATPDTPAAWTLLEELGVGWINTDHPLQLRQFLHIRRKASSK